MRTSAIWPDVTHLLPGPVLEVVAAHAADGDLEGRVADASLDALREAGYFGLPVPTEFEGGGASLVECCAVQRRLGTADAGLAIAVNMHLFSVGVMVEHWKRERDTSWMLLEAVAGQRRVVASAFAEPGLGGSLLRSKCIATPADGGWRIDGVKVPCSLAARADLVCLQAEAPSSAPEESLLVVLLPMTATGIRVERTWDTLGMRASESDTLFLDGCVIPDELVFHRCEAGFDLDDVFTAGVCWFALTATATYIGLLERALAEASDVLARSTMPPRGHARAELPSFQTLFGEATATLLTLDAACQGLAAQFDAAVDPQDLLAPALAVKHRAAEMILAAVDTAVELGGVQSYKRTGVLARLWRDAQAIRYHPPTRPATRQILGRWALGLPYTFELLEQPSPLAEVTV